MPDSLTWIGTARAAGQVLRVHTVPTIQTYTVAEHTYNAIITAHEVCKEVQGVDEHEVAKYLLTHDTEELYTGDLPAYLKVNDPVLKICVQNAEREWAKENVPKHHRYGINAKTYNVAKLCDYMELCMFCIDELNFGNKRERFLHMCDNATKYMTEYAELVNAPIVNMWVRAINGTIKEKTNERK